MKQQINGKVEAGRVTRGHFASKPGEPCGAFLVVGPCGRELKIVADNGKDPDPEVGGWEHVSVSIAGKHPPNWEEMCWVKNQFWSDEETVLQFHPKLSQYINCHPNCLHLWRQVDVDPVLPPQLLV
jgi:hypothetical protein